MMIEPNVTTKVQETKQEFESYLKEKFISFPSPVSRLEESVRYSLFSNSKRIRPLLLLFASQIQTPPHIETALAFAGAVEYIHTYSLIHDDLPCMDNDTLRRNKPTNHIQFDEATALLAGDALLTQAFALISQPLANLDLSKQIKAIYLLSTHAGIQGMVSGQAADMQVEHKGISDEDYLLFTHTYKTGKLLSVALQIGGILCNLPDEEQKKLEEFSLELGVCFQIQDDILEVTSSQEVLGKNTTSDIENKKLTYPYLYSLTTAQKMMREKHVRAKTLLNSIQGNTKLLNLFTDSLLERKQ